MRHAWHTVAKNRLQLDKSVDQNRQKSDKVRPGTCADMLAGRPRLAYRAVCPTTVWVH